MTSNVIIRHSISIILYRNFNLNADLKIDGNIDEVESWLK